MKSIITEIRKGNNLNMGCKCDWHSYMLGDGCDICNKEMAKELAEEAAKDAAREAQAEKEDNDFRRDNMRFSTETYLNHLVLPPQGSINKCCKSARHGVAYVSVNKTNKAR